MLSYYSFIHKRANRFWPAHSLMPATLLLAMILSLQSFAQPNITRVEYYFDTDPGFGNATALSITAGTDLANLTIPVNPTPLTEGVHRLYVRAKSNSGWSMTNTWLFYKPYSSSTAPPAPQPAPNISRIEYYFDTDPGFGNATALPFSAGTDLANLIIPVNPDPLSEGVHRLYLRAKSSNGWSMTNTWLFYKPYAATTAPPAPGPVPKLIAIEYYIDTDPGNGNGIPVAFENTTNLANADIFINVSGLSTGDHHFYLRSKDANGAWSMVNEKTFNVTAAQTSPSLVINSISKTTMCAYDSFSVGYHAAGSFTGGNTFTLELSNGAGSFSNPIALKSIISTASGIISLRLPSHLPDGTGYKLRLKSSTPALTSIASTTALTIHDRPNPGPDSSFYIVCANEKLSLLPGYNTAGLTATWSTATPGNAGAGVYTLMTVNSFGCRDTAYATVKQDVGTWMGTISANWHVAGNWSNGHVPTEKTHVIIAATTACIISDADAVAASVQARSGGNLKTSASKKLDIKAICNPLPN